MRAMACEKNGGGNFAWPELLPPTACLQQTSSFIASDEHFHRYLLAAISPGKSHGQRIGRDEIATQKTNLPSDT